MSPLQSMPSLFVSHGAPDLAVSGHRAADFLKSLAKTLPLPTGIVIISAHWQTRGLQATRAGPLDTIHDFQGFSPDLYKINYPACGSLDLSNQVREQLKEDGHSVNEQAERGLDHGAWIPLHLMYPEADIPVVQLSLDATLTGNQHFELGNSLSHLRKKDILIIGSGGSVHNLRAMAPEGSNTPEWASSFDNWLNKTLTQGDWDKLTSYKEHGPNFKLAHPSNEHFLPLIVAAGAGYPSPSARSLHQSYSSGSIGMSAWAFH